MRATANFANAKTRIRRGMHVAALILSLSAAAWTQTEPEFSGAWKQDNDRCQPGRRGDVTLRIEQHGLELTVESTVSHQPDTPRHAVQNYTTDGKVSVSTGIDGDEFHTSVVSKDAALIFSIEEHEDGRILQSQEKWSLIESGATLERTRTRPDGEKQILIYKRLQ
jgi:hypothetical protein